ncbi:MAG: sulfotransferase [Rhizobiales bacterium]|nr:sulfotransferase [Hyphomicrobiales bacterium]
MDVRAELLRSQQIADALRTATELASKGRVAEARTICERLLRTNPQDAEIHNLAGVVAIAENRRPEALEHFQFAVQREPNNVGYLNNLGRLFMKVDRVELAIPVYMRIAKLDPQYTTAIVAIGEFFEKMGRADKGLPYLEKFVAAKPDNYEALLMYGRMLESVGRHDDAEEVYLRLEKSPQYLVAALNRLANVKKHKEASPLLDRIDAAAAIPGLPNEAIGVLQSGAGKLLEDVGEFDKAFERYMLAAQRQVGEFDMAGFEARHDMMMGLFTPEFYATHRDYGIPLDLPVLVVGMPRSGTTLTEQIIARHPQAGGAGELMRIRLMARSLGFRGDHTAFAPTVQAMTPQQSQILAENYLQLLKFYAKDKARVVDKLPHNFEMLGFAALLFPNMHVVHCKRDAIDTCLSIFVNRFNESHRYANDLTMLGRYYREYMRLMDFWKSVLPMPIHENRYEELTEEPEPNTRALINAIGLPWDDACLSQDQSQSTVLTLSAWQVRQPIYKTSVKRWKRFEKHLGPLIDALGDRAEAA